VTVTDQVRPVSVAVTVVPASALTSGSVCAQRGTTMVSSSSSGLEVHAVDGELVGLAAGP
jgi:hypothetical protein